jgi:flagellar basal-body rod protein FlgF
MDNSFFVGLSAQQILRMRMDTTANNLANMSTVGFKADSLVMRELREKPAEARDLPNGVSFADAWRLQRDFAPGPLQRSANPLDVALEGEGFFALQTPAGTAYTRDGRFSVDADGQLVSRSGYPVLGGGGPIVIDPAAGEIAFGRDGGVMQNGVLLGALDIVAFDTPEALEKLGDNLWRAIDQTPRAPQDLRVAGGFIENSNVNAIAEMTQMIEISRAYQSVSRLISQADELRATSIKALAQVGGA